MTQYTLAQTRNEFEGRKNKKKIDAMKTLFFTFIIRMSFKKQKEYYYCVVYGLRCVFFVHSYLLEITTNMLSQIYKKYV